MSPAVSGRLRWAASLLLPLGFVHVLLFLRIPLEIYLANPAEQTIGLRDMLIVLAVLGGASLLSITLGLLALGYRLAADIRIWAIALALAVWVADSFFSRAYPVLDGTVMRLEVDRLRLALEFAVLIGLIGALALWQRRLEQPVLLFIGLLAAFNAWTVVAAARADTAARSSLSSVPLTGSPFELSPVRNVVVVLMDTFQSDFLDDVFGREPALREAFDGFVLFPDTLGTAPTTFLSLPAIHSGRHYDPQRSMSNYFDTAIRDDSFLGQLAATASHRSVLVNPVMNACPAATICITRDDLLRARSETVRREAVHLLDLALLRAAPEITRDWVFNGGRLRLADSLTAAELTGDARLIRDDDQVLAVAARRLSATASRPTALAMHLMNTHPPYVLDDRCGIIAEAEKLDRERAVQQATCGVRRFTSLLQALREQGIYDSALIVLVGDHGFAAATGAHDLDSSRVRSAGTESDMGRLIGSANPLLLIKAPGARGPLTADDRPVSLVDVPATICALNGGCTTEQGRSVFDPPAASESRQFLSYEWEHAFWDLGYIPALDIYAVRGPLADPESWERQHQGLRRRQIERIDAAGGSVISFGSGWTEPEPDSGGGSKRWAVGHQSELTVLLDPLQDPDREVGYQLDLELYTPEFIEDQQLELLLNGEWISQRRLHPLRQVVSFRLPAGLVKPDGNRVELRFDKAIVPEGPDERALATSFLSATVLEVEHRVD